MRHGDTMRYLGTTPAQRAEMLRTVGVADVEALLERIPAKARLTRELDVPAALAEGDLVVHLRDLAARNAHAEEYASFLGAGAYDHYIPSVINHLLLRGEFFTAYTPYQPEASQGTLRTIHEYQTMISALTGMDVTNASVYDGGSALAEAALMAHGVTDREEIVVSGAVSPLARRVVATYCAGPRLPIRTVPWADGATDPDALRKAVSEKTAAVLVQYPNFFGCLEDLDAAAAVAHARGALLVVSVDPIALALLRPPGEAGADIVVGEGQGVGNHLNFGGPCLGLFACRKELVRRMPGRLCGATVDKDGHRGFVLTLQTREQHIRREKATSNICTNVALVALGATVYLALMGKEGLRKVASLSTAKAHYAAETLGRVPGAGLRFGTPFFKEFVLRLPRSPDRVLRALRRKRILGGVALGQFDRTLRDSVLVAVTERRTRAEIDAYAEALASAVA
ncbi:MAG TPA: aminomethyl-transferring glycine dehydrogenase subunit GcvPA [Methylomirabilota bacterium]|nr:aminomethyl-transferring glycine dehydrogenase subunit GcvPA [Methylomirabilota bacterium]